MSLKGWEAACWGLIVSMKNGERLSLEQIQAFLDASEEFARSTAANGSLVACKSSKCKRSRMAATVAFRGAFAHRSKTVSIEKKRILLRR